MSLLVVGSVAFDDLETPFGSREHALGGSATYFSLSASRFHPVRIVAVVGEDFGPDQMRVFEGRPIDLAGLSKVKGLSFRWKGAYGYDLNEAQTLATDLNVFADFKPVLPTGYRECEYLFLGNIDPVLQLDVVRQMAKRPKWIALDTMNYWIRGARPALDAVLKEVDILLVNDAEVRELTQEYSLIKAYKKVRALGPSTLVVKRGEYGVALFTPEGIFAAPAYPLENVFDPTGAGDTFAGGFLGYLAWIERADVTALKHATLVGSVMASFTVEQFSTERLEQISQDEVRNRLALFSDMIRVEDL
ncbi:MAG TPA: PfkB family carbohydrate kinase [Geothrix sp.]|uniref:PfkB family carbohydrate kinase n=1 Tax=Geothrix mesophila TaxID=2922723 RepID=UPI001FAD1652|nr:PfkB family carbohydrate kinase [Geothrix sp. SG198]HJV37203.1 PfkB family carbohydrate kinase [Geothrix sp.]